MSVNRGTKMKTSFEIPDDLIFSIREFNKKNPDRPINMSGVCRKALKESLHKAEGSGR